MHINQNKLNNPKKKKTVRNFGEYKGFFRSYGLFLTLIFNNNSNIMTFVRKKNKFKGSYLTKRAFNFK